MSFAGFLKDTSKQFQSVQMSEESIINVLFSSGTTGVPKAIPWTQSTPIKAACDGWCHLDIQPGEVVAWPTNLGWMMGPWLVFQLMLGASIALSHDTPVSTKFTKFVTDSGMNFLGLIPSIVKAWKTKDMIKTSWEKVRRFGSTGEASNPLVYGWLSKVAGDVPILEYCGATEIGGGYV
eukprot:UN24055